MYTCLGCPGSLFDKKIFSPWLFFIIFLMFTHYGGFGVMVLSGVFGLGFQLMGFGAFGVGPSGFCGLGLSV